MLKRLLVGVVAVLGYFAYNVTVPKGCSGPWKIRMKEAIMGPIYFTIRNIIEPFDLSLSVDAFNGLLELEYSNRIDPYVKTRDTTFDGILVRVYEPKNRGYCPLPGIIYYHGGGWAIGSRNALHENTIELASEVNAVVVSVEYRTAPKVKFPVPFEDCLRATKYFLRNAKEFGVDPTRIAVAGDSAGGNLAAAVSLQLRDEDFCPKIKTQVLIYPIVQVADFNLPSYQQNAFAPVLKKSMMTYFSSMYLYGNTRIDKMMLSNGHVIKNVQKEVRKSFMNIKYLPRSFLNQSAYDMKFSVGDEFVWTTIKDAVMDQRMSPLFADDLSDLPAAYVITCQYDVLRDEGYFYAKRMMKHGTDVTYVNHETTFHGVFNQFRTVKEGSKMMSDIITYLQGNLRLLSPSTCSAYRSVVVKLDNFAKVKNE